MPTCHLNATPNAITTRTRRSGRELALTDRSSHGADPASSAIHQLEPLDAVIRVDAPQELTHSSFALAGLFDLEHAGLVRRVDINPFRSMHRGELTLKRSGQLEQPEYRAKSTTFFTVQRGNHSIQCAIDFRDSARIFALEALTDCDLFFKRSFEPELVDSITSRIHGHVEPFGLCLGAESPHSRHRTARWLGYWGAATKDSLRPDRELLARAQRHWNLNLAHWRATRSHPSSEYLRALGPETTSRTEPGTVFFQTRSFNRTDDSDANEIHEQRAQLIRALRTEFGPSFIGGFISDDLVRERYPDCVTNVPSDKASYFRAMHDASVAVYTRGLANSAAFKLSEYFAHGKCVVGEPLRTTLPKHLEDGIEWRTFTSLDECVETCRTLLADPERRASLSGNGRRYYERWIDPMVSMHRVVRRAVEFIP